MAAGNKPPIADLVGDAVTRGMTRAQVADAVGCSRVHLWRLVHTPPRKETALTRRIREVLGGGEPSRASLDEALRTIVGTDPERLKNMLQLLRILNDLTAVPSNRGRRDDRRRDGP